MSFLSRLATDSQGRSNTSVLLRIVLPAIIVLAVLMIFWPLRTVPTGHRGVITVGGAIKGIENEGFTLLAPWQTLNIFNVRSEEANIDNAEGSTSDTQPVKVSLTVRYSIQTDKVAEVFEKYSRNGDLASYVKTATDEIFKAVTAKYNAPDLITKRAQVSSEIVTGLKSKLAIYGAQVINVDMRNFSFSNEYMKAVNEKVTQDQLRLVADGKLLTVESEQKQKVKIAEAEATALKAKADGEAYATLTAAKAQAESLRIQNDALAKNRDVLELRRIEVEKVKAEKWDGALPTAIYAGAPIPFFNPGLKEGK